MSVLRLLLAVCLFAVLIAAMGPSSTASVAVGKDVKLDATESNLVYIEPYLAIDPSNQRHLVAAAFAYPPSGKRSTLQSLVSFDGGVTWKRQQLDSAYPDVWDPSVAFGKKGEIYLSYLAANLEQEDVVGQVFTSLNGGKTWKGPVSLPRESKEVADDHPTLATDMTSGPYAGNVYVITSRNERRGISRMVIPIHVFMSSDSARSFSTPVQILPNDFNNIDGNAVVLSDGTLVVCFAEVEGVNADRKPVTLHQRIWVVKSQDGGRTFSNPFLVTERDKVASAPIVAVDTSSRPFRDRIYVVANEPGNLHVWIGEEKGERWHETVIPDMDETGEVYDHRNPVVAVNDKGVVVVAWPEHLGTTDANCTEIYLAASVDGGKSFLPKTRVSTVPSCFNQSGNRIPDSERLKHTVAERFKVGGDYFGLATGSNGVFYLLWSDARDGHFTLRWSTATVQARGQTASPHPK